MMRTQSQVGDDAFEAEWQTPRQSASPSSSLEPVDQ
jgi:hypothetical protein